VPWHFVRLEEQAQDRTESSFNGDVSTVSGGCGIIGDKTMANALWTGLFTGLTL